MTNIQYEFVPVKGGGFNGNCLQSFTINDETFIVDWDGDHVGTMCISQEDYEKLSQDDVLKHFVSIDEDDEDIYIFDLGGVVYGPDGHYYIDPEEIGPMFGVTTQEYGYGNG